MTIKRINSTGRLRIVREDAQVTITKNKDGTHSFNVILNLDQYGLSPDARIFIEAHRQSTLMRFAYGTIADPRSSDSLVLTEFINPEGIQFRIKVIDDSMSKGMLLAEGNIPVRDDKEQPEDKIALLPPRPASLGEEIWRVDLSQGPSLLINESLADWRAVMQTPQFRSLVFPAAVRYVLEKIYWSKDRPELDDKTEWPYRWLQFAQGLPGVERHPPVHEDSENDWADWINSVCEQFAKRFDLLCTFTPSEEE